MIGINGALPHQPCSSAKCPFFYNAIRDDAALNAQTCRRCRYALYVSCRLESHLDLDCSNTLCWGVVLLAVCRNVVGHLLVASRLLR